MPITLKTHSGTTIILEDKPFEKGGEGSIHRVVSSPYLGLCVKIYHPKIRDLQKKHKVEYLVHNAPFQLKNNTHTICWAKEAVYKGNEFLGFIMPLAFDNSIQLYDLCTMHLKKNLPAEWDLKYDRRNRIGIESRIKLCTNISSLIHAIHQLDNYVLVDLKPQNLLVTIDGKVSLTDCDSIQVSNNGRILFPAKVATPEYVPPEGTKYSINKNIVGQTWDRFSLAVVFYEILFGLHPYAASFEGKYVNSNTLASKIKDGLYVHGRHRTFITVLPPPHNNYSRIPDSIRKLFERALNKGDQMPDVRPSAEEWGKTFFEELKKKEGFNFKILPKSKARKVINKPNPISSIKVPTQPIIVQPSKVFEFLNELVEALFLLIILFLILKYFRQC